MRRPTGLALAMTIPLACLVGASLALVSGAAPGQSRVAQAVPSPPGRCSAPAGRPALPYTGDAPGAPFAAQVARFTRAAGKRPSVIETYTRFGRPFDAARTCQVIRRGALPLIQWNPVRTSLAAIAAGRYDHYVTDYADSVRAIGASVVLSFAHEMNGKWCPWGYTHTSPSVFIAAWRHLHDLFARARARNVIWLWNVNRDTSRSHSSTVAPPRAWWPGSTYVDWAGIDAYFTRPSDTFFSVFGRTLVGVRALTDDPVLIAETAVAPGPGQARQIRSLFAGVRSTPGLLGFVWFDQNGRKAWPLENRPAATTAFSGEVPGHD